MPPRFSLPFMLPTLYMLQMVSLCGPWFGLPGPGVRDTYRNDLE